MRPSELSILRIMIDDDAFNIHNSWQEGTTPLSFAAINGHADCVRLLLDAGADKNAADGVRCRFAPRLRNLIGLALAQHLVLIRII
jgi:hypothetical protein